MNIAGGGKVSFTFRIKSWIWPLHCETRREIIIVIIIIIIISSSSSSIIATMFMSVRV